MVFKQKAAALLGMAACALTLPALAGTEASLGLSSTYLFRGMDRSNGYPQVYGDLTYRTDVGVYASVWGSSYGAGDEGETSAHPDRSEEYDLILGWAKAFENVDLNLGLINYNYPGDTAADDFGSESEAYIGVAGNGFEAYLYRNVASAWGNNEGYYYLATSFTYKRFSSTLGFAADGSLPNVSYAGYTGGGKYRYFHLDMTYAFNENLSFTLSQIVDRSMSIRGDSVDENDMDGVAAQDSRFSAVDDKDLLFVVTYAMPIAF